MARTAPKFWWKPRAGVAAFALWPVSRIWAGAALRRLRKPSWRAPVPVVCVGNFVVGGAGKTPAVIALVEIARERGLNPGLLGSGYGGSLKGATLVDRAVHTAGQVGDEAMLLSAVAPTVVCRDRAAGARRLVEEGVDIIIMDDGFQNPSLAFDLSLVAVDAAAGIGNGHVIPSGPLRAPLAPQLRRAGALLVIGEGEGALPVIRAAARAGRPVVRARTRPTRHGPWGEQRYLAFAGIGRPEKFFDALRAAGAPVARTLSFGDHYAYSAIDADKLLGMAGKENLRLITTEKDLVRLAGRDGALATLHEKAETFPVVLEFENPEIIGEMLDDAVRASAMANALSGKDS